MAGSTLAPPDAGAASTSRADKTPSPSAGWGLLYRYAFVVSAGDLQGGDEFELHLEVPPRASCLTISRALLADAANPRSTAFVHCVDASGRLLLCSVTQGPGTERLVVCRAGRGKASPLPEVPAALERQLSTRDVVGIVSVPRGGGGHSYAVAQLHAVPASAPPTAQTSATMVPVMSASGSSSSAPSTTLTSSVMAQSASERSAATSSSPPAARTASVSSCAPPSLTSPAMTERSATAPSAPLTSGTSTMSASGLYSSAPSPTLTSSAMAQAATKCPTAPDSTPSADARPVTTASEAAVAVIAVTEAVHTGSGTAASPPPAPVHGLAFQLLIYSSRENTWKVKSLLISPFSDTLVGFRADSVIAHDERLTFVDLTCGIVLCCKTLHNQPEATFVPFPKLHRQIMHDCSIGKRRCMALSEGKLIFVVISDSPAGQDITVWSLLDSREDTASWAQEWQVNLHDLGNWQLSDSLDLISINPTTNSCILLSRGNCIFMADLHKQVAFDSHDFFINVGNISLSSLQFCSWFPPCLSADEGLIFSLKKKKKSMLKYPKMVYNLLDNNRRYIDIANRGKTWIGPAVDQALGVPVSSFVSTASSYLKRGIEVGEVLGSRLPCPTEPEELKVVTIENEDQAWSAIKSWREAGTPPFTYVAFAEGMKEADIAVLKQFVTEHGAKPLLWLVE